MNSSPNYLNPNLPAGLRRVCIPVVEATSETLRGYGELIDSPDARAIEITRWPARGWRPVDLDSGDEGGTKQGIFNAEWKGSILYGTNEAVGGEYILGYSDDPAKADTTHDAPPVSILLWHANYHPDGGQLFFPLEPKPYLVPLAKPGDDVRPEDFVCFRFSGNQGLYIHPDIWHEGVFPLRGTHRFFDRQGAVHARVSVDFAREFSCLLQVDLSGL
jgi:hypothetical protein